MQLLAELIVAMVILVAVPVLLCAGAIALLWLLVLMPFILVGVSLYIWLRRKDKLMCKPAPMPSDAKSVTIPKPRKPITMKMNGKDVPIGVLIGSTIFGIIIAILLFVAVLLWIPWGITMCVGLILVGVQIGKSK
jgi:hypothetical protein